jgi:hypothetical protein
LGNILFIFIIYIYLNIRKPSKGHVMISYNWASQPMVVRIAHSLKENGYLIWLDTEQMKGSTLEASMALFSLFFPFHSPFANNNMLEVAEAVEQAELVLMCMTQKYKDSPNCRLEGEYCQTRKVDFIPLIMQNGYKPDGWYFNILQFYFADVNDLGWVFYWGPKCTIISGT